MKKNGKRIKNYGVKYTEDAPHKESMPQNKVLIIGSGKFHKWALIICPCGCGDTITLCLMNSYDPNWRFSVDWLGRPTLYPSIWRTEGCKSHFHLQKGKIRWANEGRKKWQLKSWLPNFIIKI
jgi:hypothetical protein